MKPDIRLIPEQCGGADLAQLEMLPERLLATLRAVGAGPIDLSEVTGDLAPALGEIARECGETEDEARGRIIDWGDEDDFDLHDGNQREASTTEPLPSPARTTERKSTF